MNKETTIGGVLIDGLKNIGIKHVFGVPGDYALDFLDRVIESGLEFVGTCNELNAGYAADGYARAQGAGAAIVTYGVGGFSILNAVAGAWAEQVPLIVISGAPHSRQRRAGALVHHLAGDYALQSEIFKKMTIDSAVLDNPRTAAADIERVLANCLARKKPVYFEIPVDAVDQPCDPRSSAGSRPAVAPVHPSNPAALAEAAGEAADMINTAKNPVVIAGVEIARFQLAAPTLKLVETAELPYATTISSKSVLPELHPQFVGVYQGAFSRESTRAQIESSDCVLCLGVWMNDFNTGMFTTKLDENSLLNAHSDYLQIKHHGYNNIRLDDFIAGLIPLLRPRSFIQSHPLARALPRRNYRAQAGQKITVRRFYERINNLLDDNMILISDTGDCICAAADLYIEEAENFIAQAYYLSIGFSLPAALGVSLSSPGKRAVVLIGDGAFQMTAQELSTIIRKECNPIIFVLNNQGYVIERMIHDGVYNDIQNWKYHKLGEAFGSGNPGAAVRAEDELEKAIEAALADNTRPALIEIVLEPRDCSEVLAVLGREVRGLSKLPEGGRAAGRKLPPAD
ncbi:MAG: thiamine pyrophosphate-binding protein [Kiritimatiellae bacterium]|nr:thiamine pyrophosphate-binding protein [Kiritimatiellia bacterium]